MTKYKIKITETMFSDSVEHQSKFWYLDTEGADFSARRNQLLWAAVNMKKSFLSEDPLFVSTDKEFIASKPNHTSYIPYLHLCQDLLVFVSDDVIPNDSEYSLIDIVYIPEVVYVTDYDSIAATNSINNHLSYAVEI